MNAKQVTSIVASLAAAAPPLVVIGGIVALAVWFFSDDDKKETENAPGKAAPETKPLRIGFNFGRNLTENRGITANSSEKPSVLPAPTAIPANPASAAPKTPVQTTFPSGQIVPATTATEHQRLRVPLTSGGNTVQNRPIPSNPGEKPGATPAPTPIRAGFVLAAPKVPVAPLPTLPAAQIAPGIPKSAQEKFITRENLAKVFTGGTRGLTRKSAVAALKALGFGKTAAYEALAINGRFASWLQFAPDGIITWNG